MRDKEAKYKNTRTNYCPLEVKRWNSIIGSSWVVFWSLLSLWLSCLLCSTCFMFALVAALLVDQIKR